MREILKKDAAPAAMSASGAAVIDVTDESKGSKNKKGGFGKAPPPVRAPYQSHSTTAPTCPPARCLSLPDTSVMPPCLQPPPKPAVEEDDEPVASSSSSSKSTPTPATTITPQGSRVEVVKQEGGMTLLREVKDGKVVSSTVSEPERGQHRSSSGTDR